MNAAPAQHGLVWRASLLLLLAGLRVAYADESASAQLQVLPEKEPQRVFAGEGRVLNVTFRNSGRTPVQVEVHTRLFQAATATAALVREVPWKQLQVLPGQTVLEVTTQAFPSVKAETRFLLEWTDGVSRVLGRTDVLVYPPDLLHDLHPLANGEALGLYDPANQLKPLLRATGLQFQDLEQTGLGAFSGKLAIIGPFPSLAQEPSNLASTIKALAQKGTAVVWIQPPAEKPQQLQPSYFSVPEGKGTVVVAQAALASSLLESPQAQLNLLQLARLAVEPEIPHLPRLTSSP